MSRRWIILAILFVVFHISVSAQDVPVQDGYVLDEADIFSAGQEETLEAKLSAIDVETAVEIVVVTMPDCGSNPVNYRYRFYNTWGIGPAETDEGLLLLLCMTLDNRSFEQEVGLGLEDTFSSERTAQIAATHFSPSASEGNIYDGILRVVEEYERVLTGGDTDVSAQAQVPYNPWTDRVVMIVVIVFILLIVLYVIGGGSGGTYSGSSTSRRRTSSSRKTGGSSGGTGSSTKF